MLNWANQFNICCFLDDHGYHQNFHSFDYLLAVGANKIFSPAQNILSQLPGFLKSRNGWLFGHIGYDLKNEIEYLHSAKIDNIGFPEIFLFEPEIVIEVKGTTATIYSVSTNPGDIFNRVLQHITANNNPATEGIIVKSAISKQHYLETIQRLKAHILRGDCYEINFCQEFFASPAEINPLAVFNRLSHISPSPFSCYYRLEDKYLLCASPERYIKKAGNTVISQPMKGTAKRNTLDPVKDGQLKTNLANSDKDKSENVMVVDLVRNDLGKICIEGSVEVGELFGVYTFPQVHQMVSTIKGALQPGIGLAEILHATFPMGSMTGAPKKRVMELIEEYEPVKRGIFSGAVGYITPGGDFDFNVIIRSILYNARTKYLSYLVGSGITFYSDEEKEYEECLLKAQAMEQALK